MDDQCAGVWVLVRGVSLLGEGSGNHQYYQITGLAFDDETTHKNARRFTAVYNPIERNGQFEFLD